MIFDEAAFSNPPWASMNGKLETEEAVDYGTYGTDSSSLVRPPVIRTIPSSME